MANLKEIRQRINSVKTTRQVTSAMKMVAAAKLRKAQDAILQLRPYDNKLYRILKHINVETDDWVNKYAQERPQRKVLIVLMASNRGLCGPFNTNVARDAATLISRKYADFYMSGNLDIVVIGKKLEELIKARGFSVAKTYHDLLDNGSYTRAAEIAQKFMDNFYNEKYDNIQLIYNRFKNAAVQILTEEQFLPIELEEEDEAIKYHREYIFEPSVIQVLRNIIPMSLKTHFYRALLESRAAEEGARMTAMHKATDNATDLIRELTLTYNKARQAQITKEITEIVGGANALGK